MDFGGDIYDSCVLIFNYFSQKREKECCLGIRAKDHHKES
jgi:hypothetical protein